VARLEAVLRRTSPEPDQSVIAVTGLEMDLAAHTVRRDGEMVHLTPTEFELLRMFVRNRGRLLTHRMVLTEVWGPEYADDVTVLRGQIANLRRKLAPARSAGRHYIRTEPGIGYRFDPK
jgi:two-component system, OmpR family, KDP operon response regulator KdpE